MQIQEPIRARVVTAVVIAALSCICLGVRVKLKKAAIAPSHAPLQQRDTQETPPGRGLSEQRFQTILDFCRLSASSRRTLTLILLIPAGTLITAVYQRFVGLRTLGTFAPTLLALSQVKSDWEVGLLVFFTTFGVGLFFRMMFSPLKLPAVSRRGIVAVFVVLFLAIAISLFEFFNVAVNARAVFLPVVVTTMMIERFFIVLGKDGSRAAAYALINSLIIAVTCFVLFSFTPIGAVILAFPELELLIISGLVLIGCYHKTTLVGLLGFGKEVSGELED